MSTASRRVRRIAVPTVLFAVAGTIGALTWLRTREADEVKPPRTVDPAGREDVSAVFRISIPSTEVRSILKRLQAGIPAQLSEKSPAELDAAWPAWVAQHQGEVTARLHRGDLDSVVNFWLYGTRFTTLPRVTAVEIRKPNGVARGEELMLRRLDDLVSAVAEPGADERLRFVRDVVGRHGIDPSTPEGGEKARLLLAQARNEMVAENKGYRARLESTTALSHSAKLQAYSTVYDDRGLSSDTSIGVNFALDAAFGSLKTAGKIRPGGVRRVAIVGPGLDFVDKAEGHDFYPPQTIQPFAVMDSLFRLDLARHEDLGITTVDVSRRVTQHLEDAARRAADGAPYVLQLPLEHREPAREWIPDLVQWWERLGSTIGNDVEPLRPGADSAIRVRAIRIQPAIVRLITPRELNIVLERLRLSDADRFDLIIATNVLVYYGRFEQALALANIASMLRPGGFLLTNYVVSASESLESAAALSVRVRVDRQGNGDTMLLYERVSHRQSR